MPLNIDLHQIILHLQNFVVLTGILYFLLYKPVKQFMDDRSRLYADREEQSLQQLKKSEELIGQYNEKLASADEEIEGIKAQARKDAAESSTAIIHEAEKQAEKIISRAKDIAEFEKQSILKQAEVEIKDLLCQTVEKFAESDSTSDAYDMFLKAAQEEDKK